MKYIGESRKEIEISSNSAQFIKLQEGLERGKWRIVTKSNLLKYKNKSLHNQYILKIIFLNTDSITTEILLIGENIRVKNLKDKNNEIFKSEYYRGVGGSIN